MTIIQAGVYQIRNVKNDRVYIGSSMKLQNRLATHKRKLEGGYHDNPGLQNTVNQHGIEVFEFSILEVLANPSDEDLLAREQYWLDTKQSYLKENGYNIEPVAGRPPLKKGRSQYHGVTWGEELQKWGVAWWVDGIKKTIAYLGDEEVCAKAWDALVCNYFPEQLPLNFGKTEPKTVEQIIQQFWDAKYRKRKSPYIGIYEDKRTGRWGANIKIKGKTHHLGIYENPEVAAKVYDHVALWLGRKRVNFPGASYPLSIDEVHQKYPKQAFKARRRPSKEKPQSPYHGVSFARADRPSPWLAQIHAEENIYSKYCKTAEEAALTYDRLAIELFGIKAKLNFPHLRQSYVDGSIEVKINQGIQLQLDLGL